MPYGLKFSLDLRTKNDVDLGSGEVMAATIIKRGGHEHPKDWGKSGGGRGERNLKINIFRVVVSISEFSLRLSF